jgi:hypothetical protein
MYSAPICKKCERNIAVTAGRCTLCMYSGNRAREQLDKLRNYLEREEKNINTGPFSLRRNYSHWVVLIDRLGFEDWKNMSFTWNSKHISDAVSDVADKIREGRQCWSMILTSEHFKGQQRDAQAEKNLVDLQQSLWLQELSIYQYYLKVCKLTRGTKYTPVGSCEKDKIFWFRYFGFMEEVDIKLFQKCLAAHCMDISAPGQVVYNMDEDVLQVTLDLGGGNPSNDAVD